MKNGEPKRKPPSARVAKASRTLDAAARAANEVRRVSAEQLRAGATDRDVPMPDLTKYGVSEREAREHVGRCEPCGRAHKHVAKNPKDAMALDSFGRRIASCLAVQGDKARV